jgi:hypothetical protein
MRKKFLGHLGALGVLGATLLVASCASATSAPPTQESASVGAAATEVPTSTVEPSAEPEGSVTYTDPAGYTVDLPGSWAGKYMPAVVPAQEMAILGPKAKSMTRLLHTPADARLEPQALLTLSTYTAADWGTVSKEEGPPVGAMAGVYGDNMVLVATTPQDTPYPPGTADAADFEALYQALDLGQLNARAATPEELADSAATPEAQVAATPEPGSPIEPVVVIQPLPADVTPEAGTEVAVPVMAADPDGVAKVELQINGITVASTDWPNAEKFFEGAVNWKPEQPGSYEVVAIATDPEGHTSELSRETITVAPPPVANSAKPAATAAPRPTAQPAAPAADKSPPSVSIEPKATKIAPGEKMVVYTNAVHPSGIVKLELHVNDKIRAVWNYDGPAGEAPKSAFQTLTWPDAKAGQYTVFVTAVTGGGGVGQSVKEKVRVR